MKDVRREHPVNDPEHQRTCERCRQMDLLGQKFVEWSEAMSLNHRISDEVYSTFFLFLVANITIDSELEGGGMPGLIDEVPKDLSELRARFLREAAQAFDAAEQDLRAEWTGA